MPAVSFQPPKKEKLTGILAIVLYLGMGVLLLVKPDLMAEFTRWAMFAVLLVYAVLSFWKYMKTPAEEAAKGYTLTGAMIAATLAVLALFEVSLLTDRIWGILLLAGGYMKFQTAMDMGRLGHQRWWLFLLPCAVSLIFGVLIVTEIIRTNTALFIGVAMVVEGVVDIAALFMTARSEHLNRKVEKGKQQEENTENAQEENTEAAAEPAEEPTEEKQEEQPAETSEN